MKAKAESTNKNLSIIAAVLHFTIIAFNKKTNAPERITSFVPEIVGVRL